MPPTIVANKPSDGNDAEDIAERSKGGGQKRDGVLVLATNKNTILYTWV